MKTLPRLAAILLLLAAGSARAESPLYTTSVKTIDGADASLAPYKGSVMLVVNVASKCGNTPQYAALEGDYEKYKDKGLVVVGFPCNQFKEQEPGSAAQIKEFCTSTYHVAFPMFDKVDVNGPARNPIYNDLAGPGSPFPGDIKWNFTKFLIGRDGKILARFEPKTKPDSPEVITAIETALAAK